jgi:hypothetical protein
MSDYHYTKLPPITGKVVWSPETGWTDDGPWMVRTSDLVPGDVLADEGDVVVSVVVDPDPRCVVRTVRVVRNGKPEVRFAGVDAVHQVIR